MPNIEEIEQKYLNDRCFSGGDFLANFYFICVRLSTAVIANFTKFAKFLFTLVFS